MSKSICKLKLDIGIHVTSANQLSKREEDLWMKVVTTFNYLSPSDLVVEVGKDTYACKLYRENHENCKKCPLYQP
jgi:hypothetical protein